MKWQLTLAGFIGLVAASVIGGVAFHFLESDHETAVATAVITGIRDFIVRKSCIDISKLKALSKILKLSDVAGVKIGLPKSSPVENITNWDLRDAIFLAFQTLGSVGFGNAPPATAGGKVFCVFYILCGVPLFALTALGVGELLSALADAGRNAFYRRILKREAPPCTTCHATVCNTASLFLFGFVLFILVPAAIFYSLETSWTYGDALYGTLMVTLTIGFTDFLPGENAPTSYRSTYRILVGIWIIIVLYWFAGVFYSISGLFNFKEEVQKPLDVAIHEENAKDANGQQKIKVDKKWKKNIFDKQWKKTKPNKGELASKRREAGDRVSANQVAAISHLDVVPVYNPTRLYPAVVSSSADSGPVMLTPFSLADNNVSRITIGS